MHENSSTSRQLVPEACTRLRSVKRQQWDSTYLHEHRQLERKLIFLSYLPMDPVGHIDVQDGEYFCPCTIKISWGLQSPWTVEGCEAPTPPTPGTGRRRDDGAARSPLFGESNPTAPHKSGTQGVGNTLPAAFRTPLSSTENIEWGAYMQQSRDPKYLQTKTWGYPYIRHRTFSMIPTTWLHSFF